MGLKHGFWCVKQYIKKANKVKINKNIYLIYLIGIYYYGSIYIFVKV